MPPITIRFDEKIEARLRRKADEDKATLSDVVRRLVVDGLDRAPQKMTPYEAWKLHFKGWEFGEPDDAENEEAKLREIFDEKRRRLG